MTIVDVDMVKAWVVTLGVAVIHTGLLAFNVGRLRGAHKSFATEEDRVKAGGTGIVGDVPEVQRANAAHRNQLENLPLFIGASIIFIYAAGQVENKNFQNSPFTTPTNRDFIAGIILFTVWVALRLCHSVAYMLELQPWRTLCFLLAQITVFTTALYAIINILVNA